MYVEVDEGQHRAYGAEAARMAEIGAAGGRPAVFVRYNPDGYRPAAGQRAEAGAARRARLKASVAWARGWARCTCTTTGGAGGGRRCGRSRRRRG